MRWSLNPTQLRMSYGTEGHFLPGWRLTLEDKGYVGLRNLRRFPRGFLCRARFGQGQEVAAGKQVPSLWAFGGGEKPKTGIYVRMGSLLGSSSVPIHTPLPFPKYSISFYRVVGTPSLSLQLRLVSSSLFLSSVVLSRTFRLPQ